MINTNSTPFHRNCNTCGREVKMLVDSQDLVAWMEGELIQNAMPYLTPDERELLISGICGTCFDDMFPPENDDGLDDEGQPRQDWPKEVADAHLKHWNEWIARITNRQGA